MAKLNVTVTKIYWNLIHRMHIFILKSLADTQSSICNVFQLHTHTQSAWCSNCGEMFHEIHLLICRQVTANCHDYWKFPIRSVVTGYIFSLKPLHWRTKKKVDSFVTHLPITQHQQRSSQRASFKTCIYVSFWMILIKRPHSCDGTFISIHFPTKHFPVIPPSLFCPWPIVTHLAHQNLSRYEPGVNKRQWKIWMTISLQARRPKVNATYKARVKLLHSDINAAWIL